MQEHLQCSNASPGKRNSVFHDFQNLHNVSPLVLDSLACKNIQLVSISASGISEELPCVRSGLGCMDFTFVKASDISKSPLPVSVQLNEVRQTMKAEDESDACGNFPRMFEDIIKHKTVYRENQNLDADLFGSSITRFKGPIWQVAGPLLHSRQIR